MVEWQIPKLHTRVRFPSPPHFFSAFEIGCSALGVRCLLLNCARKRRTLNVQRPILNSDAGTSLKHHGFPPKNFLKDWKSLFGTSEAFFPKSFNFWANCIWSPPCISQPAEGTLSAGRSSS